ncbi:MAG TPA: hypothetical protein VFG31_09235 [Conexibacter sp.]|nr:hypothetical protein [Conexibacter sp.]
MSPNRIVALLTPLVFAPLAGAAAAWISQHFPGVDVQQSDLQQIFIAGALIALAPAAQWLHGWQKHEARQGELQQQLALATAAALPAGPSGWSDPAQDGAEASNALDALDPLDQLDQTLLDEEDPAEAWS